MSATICYLTYGTYCEYFQRAVRSALHPSSQIRAEIRAGFNAATESYSWFRHELGCDESATGSPDPSEIQRHDNYDHHGCRVRVWNSPVNLFKEPMARRMFYDIPIVTEYVIWFDDDSYVEPGWWEALQPLLERKIDYIGQEWWVYYLPGQTEMIQAQPWYRRVPFETRGGRPGIHFMTGGFLAVRTERIYEANYPDVEFTWKGDTLKQYGGDTLLGEIARQLGWSRARHDKHIKINIDLNGNHPAPRRGGTGRQFGSDVEIAIK